MYVYILSEYEEYGAKNVTATLDRSKLLDMARGNWPFQAKLDHYFPPEIQKREHEKWIARALAGLATFLARPDEELVSHLEGWNCHDGGGGMMLHVIRLV